MSRRRRRRRPRIEAGGTLVLDSGAITKIASGDELARTLLKEITAKGWRIEVPTAVLAEVITGRATDAPANRLVRAVDNVVPIDEGSARIAGVLRFKAKATSNPSGTDALVAAAAVSRQPALVMTTDPDDLSALIEESSGVSVLAV